MSWRAEISELHEFFEAYFAGRETSLDRADRVLASGFTIIGPDGSVSDRAATLHMLANGHASRQDIAITTSDQHLVFEADDVIVAGYIEHQTIGERQTKRASTAVFIPDSDAPNGLAWLRVHETWIDD